MSLVELFDKLPISVKGIILILASILPFWLIAFYLFYPAFYYRGDYLILGAFCFCFSLVWLYLNLLISIFILKTKKPDLKTINPNGAAVMAGSIAISHLTICIATAYVFKQFIEIGFHHFLIWIFVYGAFIYLRANTHFKLANAEQEKKSTKN